MANVQQIIVDAAQRHNVPVEALLAIAKIESGFNPNAQNPNSSAGGVFQFTDATAKEYGLTGDKRNDIEAQADAAARMAQANSRALSSTLGRAPTAGELYLAHQQGLTGARALLANPEKTAAEALEGIYGGRAASVVRQNGGDPNARASQFASQWVNKGNQTAGLFPPGELPQVASLQDTRRPTPPPAVPPRRPDGDSRLHPFDAATNKPRPNADGSYSTEVTRTVQLPDGNWANVPSLWWGQGSTVRDFGSMDDDQLANYAARYERETGNGFPRYGGIPEAERAAIARSEAGGGSNRPITYPGSLVAQTFNQLPRPGGNNAGDSLAMRPVQGGRQQAPMFDAAYDERVGSMRQTRQPIDSQGMATGSSRPPAPVPASPYDRVTARLNALPPAAPVPASPYDRVTARLNALPAVPAPSGASPTTRTVQSVPVRGNVPSGGFAGQERAAPGSLPRMTIEQMYAGIYPEKPGDFLLGGNTPNRPTTAPTTGISPYQVAQIGVPAMPEIPGAPRTRMASAAPFPMPRPSFMPSVGTSLSVRPMPPMPIPRPMVQQQRRAPVPMPLSMRPQQQRAPLRITVQRDQPQQQQASRGGVIAPPSSGYGSSGYSTVVSPGGSHVMDRNGNWVERN